MHGAEHPLPNTSSWHGAYLKHRDNFIFIFTSKKTHRITVTNISIQLCLGNICCLLGWPNETHKVTLLATCWVAERYSMWHV